MNAIVAAIPPPPFSVFHLGPLTIRMYGIMIGLGVLAAVWLTGRLFEERGIGDVDDAASIAVWGVLAGIIGARLYHVVTDFQNFRGDNFVDVFKIWTGGLGIPGGILFGTLAGLWAAKRRGIPLLAALSCAAPAIPLAQSIGRWGNYFNQELYGRPTTLPWGLEISNDINTGYPVGTLFHPTFLYESLWNLGLCLALVWLFHHRTRLQPGRLFPLYMVGYGVGRLWVESLRIDPANKIGPFRTNIWMSMVLIIAGTAWFVMSRNSTARWPHPLRLGGADGVDGRDEDGHDDEIAGDDGHRDDDAQDEADGGEAPDRDEMSSASDSDNRSDQTAAKRADRKLTSSQAGSSTASARASGSEADLTRAANTTTSNEAGSNEAGSNEAGSNEAGSSGPAPKKAPAKKAPTKNTPTRKAPAKKAPAKKASAEKAPAKKASVKKAPSQASAASSAKKAPAKKAPAKKPDSKKPDSKKSTGRSRRSGAESPSGGGGASMVDPGLTAAKRAAESATGDED